MRTQKLTTDLAVAAMLMGMAGLVVNIFGLWHYIYIVLAGKLVDTESEAQIRSVYVFMNIPLKLALIVCSIAMLYRAPWGRWGMTVVGLVSIAHSIVATLMLDRGVVHYWMELSTEGESLAWLALVRNWDMVVLVLVLMFYGLVLWHLHRRSTREEFRPRPKAEAQVPGAAGE